MHLIFIKLLLSIKAFVLPILSVHLRQVLLYNQYQFRNIIDPGYQNVLPIFT